MPHLFFRSSPAHFQGLSQVFGQGVYFSSIGSSALLSVASSIGRLDFLLLLRRQHFLVKLVSPLEVKWRAEVKMALQQIAEKLQDAGWEIVTQVNWQIPYHPAPEKLLDWREVMKGGGLPNFFPPPYLVEIGFGYGEFLAHLTEKHPQKTVVGLELSIECIRIASKKLKEFSNVVLFRIDGVDGLRTLFPSGSVEGVYLMFPDPWEKRKHKKRRLLSPFFVQLLLERLKKGGKFIFVTDSASYSVYARKLFHHQNWWKSEQKTLPFFPTRYAKKWGRLGEKVWTLEVEKREQNARKIAPLHLLSFRHIFPVDFSTFSAHLVPKFAEFSSDGLVLKEIFSGEREFLCLAFLKKKIGSVPIWLRFSAVENGVVCQLHNSLPPLVDDGDEKSLMAWAKSVEEKMLSQKLGILIDALEKRFGEPNWWPFDAQYHQKEGSLPEEEIVLGAILTQNTSWKNVERCLEELKWRKILSFEGIENTGEKELAEIFRITGMGKQKARTAKNWIRWFRDALGGKFSVLSEQNFRKVRKEMLKIPGIGLETADSILLYAFHSPIMVISAYARRILSRIGLSSPISSAHRWQELFDSIFASISDRARIYQKFHALLVELGKRNCHRQNPLCSFCPVLDFCFTGKQKNKIKLGEVQK